MPQPAPRVGGGGTDAPAPPTAIGAETPATPELLIVNRTSDVGLAFHGSAFLCRLVPKQRT